MRVTSRGAISYAGFDKAALWALAKQAFAQTDEPMPERFQSFLPLFPIELIQSMRYVAPSERQKALVSSGGFSIDPREYHRALYAEMPELYADDNRRRNFDYEDRFVGRGVFCVDQTWATIFPQYQPFMGERLVLYPIGGGAQAVAVPQSVYPRGCGVLRGAEVDMRVAARCQHYAAYVRERVAAGEAFDAERFEGEYLRVNGLAPVSVRQYELGRVMQDMSILKSLRIEQSAVGLYTENAKRAEHIAQYAPFHTACDPFEATPMTRTTARLLQLRFENDDFISDLWMPYRDASEYVSKRDMTLDARALCEGFQIPPAYDPETLGGRYPNAARVVVVRDRDLRLMVADTLNNPAYGSGMNPLGMINKLVFLPDSREHLRLNRLTEEQTPLRCVNTAVSPKDYLRMLAAAAAQEHKGALCDTLYRREAVLSQMQRGSATYLRARELLNQKAARIETLMSAEDGERERAQLSGYDADVDYLRRMYENRERDPDDEEARKPVAFAPDAQRDLSVESGYAMRGCFTRFRYEELALPEEAEEADGEEPASSPDAEGQSPEEAFDGEETANGEDGDEEKSLRFAQKDNADDSAASAAESADNDDDSNSADSAEDTDDNADDSAAVAAESDDNAADSESLAHSPAHFMKQLAQLAQKPAGVCASSEAKMARLLKQTKAKP